jgi:hypothetical protein
VLVFLFPDGLFGATADVGAHLTLIILGLSLFALGAIVNAVGWTVDKRSKKGISDDYLQWLLSTIRQWFAMLTGRTSTSGERLAAFGAILCALGLVIAVVGVAALGVG